MQIRCAIAVGYQNDNVEYDGYRMMGNGFVGIGAIKDGKPGCWLSQMIPSGYLNNDWYTSDGEGCNGDFQVHCVSSAGKLGESYLWYHACNWGPDEWDPKGYWSVGGNPVEETGAANDVFFPKGTGFYFRAPSKSDSDLDATYSLNQSGAVETNDVRIVFIEDGYQILSNPFPVPIKLSQIVPMGYLENAWYTSDGEGCNGDFQLQLVTTDGKLGGTYMWYHACNWGPDEWDVNGRWTDPAGNDIPGDGTGVNDLVIPAGGGFYFRSPSHDGDDGNDYYAIIKCPVKL